MNTATIDQLHSSEAGTPQHCFALGTSGIGKTYATKLRVLRLLDAGVRSYVIDVHGEYGGLARETGGRVLDPAAAGLSPFHNRIGTWMRDDPGSAVNYASQPVVRILQALYSEDADGTIPHETAMLLYHLVDRTLGAEGDGSTYRMFLEAVAHESSDVGGPVALSLVRMVASAARRDPALVRMLGSESVLVESDEPTVTVFDLSQYEPRQAAILAACCLHALETVAERSWNRRMVVVEDIDALSPYRVAAESLLSFLKRVWTMGFEVLMTGQHTPSIVGAPGSIPLLASSARRLWFRQPPGWNSENSEAMGLPPHLHDDLRQAGRGEGLLQTHDGEGYAWMRVSATDAEHRLCVAGD